MRKAYQTAIQQFQRNAFEIFKTFFDICLKYWCTHSLWQLSVDPPLFSYLTYNVFFKNVFVFYFYSWSAGVKPKTFHTLGIFYSLPLSHKYNSSISLYVYIYIYINENPKTTLNFFECWICLELRKIFLFCFVVSKYLKNLLNWDNMLDAWVEAIKMFYYDQPNHLVFGNIRCGSDLVSNRTATMTI